MRYKKCTEGEGFQHLSDSSEEPLSFSCHQLFSVCGKRERGREREGGLIQNVSKCISFTICAFLDAFLKSTGDGLCGGHRVWADKLYAI